MKLPPLCALSMALLLSACSRDQASDDEAKSFKEWAPRLATPAPDSTELPGSPVLTLPASVGSLASATTVPPVATPTSNPSSTLSRTSTPGPAVGAAPPLAPVKPLLPKALPTQDNCAAADLVVQEGKNIRWLGAASNSGGDPAGFVLPNSKNGARLVTIRVSEPGRIGLLLGAYDPNVWVIETAPGTEVVAVVASGYHTQRVTGIKASTPVVITSFEGGSPCGYAYEPAGLQGVLQRLAGVRAERIEAAKAVTLVGPQVAAYSSAPGAPKPQQFAQKTMFAPEVPGVRQAVASGHLRAATQADLDKLPKGLSGVRLSLNDAFVVQKTMELPTGLYGGNGGYFVFIVPKGVARPTGDPGHTTVLDLNSSNPCIGVQCQIR